MLAWVSEQLALENRRRLLGTDARRRYIIFRHRDRLDYPPAGGVTNTARKQFSTVLRVLLSEQQAHPIL